MTEALLLALALLFCLLFAARKWMEPRLRRFAAKTGWCMLLLACLPVVLRLALLQHHPVPTPNTADDYSYVLLGDTLAHFRLANAVHPMHRFFEAIFVLQEPHYSSIFPLGQGLVLALGQLFFGDPWAGVVLSMGVFSALSYWMLRGWVSPAWALMGALLGVFEIGPLSSWMNSYWGGAVSAIAGCLAFGAMVRLREAGQPRHAVLLGLGLGLEILTRPFESTLLLLCVLLYFARDLRKLRISFVAITMSPALLLTLAHNRAVTGSWTTLPYMLSRDQYGVPATFTFQPNAEAHRELTHEQELDYHAQRAVHGDEPETPQRYLDRLIHRLPSLRFFFNGPPWPWLVLFLWALKEPRYRWASLWVAIFLLGTNVYPYFYPQYVAALAPVFLLISVAGLRQHKLLASAGLFLCLAQFGFWYGLHFFYNPALLEKLERYETPNYINHGDADGRAAVNRRLAQEAGKQLVFVRYGPQHLFDEWIHNAAEIDKSPVVFALDRGEDNIALRKYFPDRKAWVLEPDARPPQLYPYPEEKPAPQPKPLPKPTMKIDPKTFVNVH